MDQLDRVNFPVLFAAFMNEKSLLIRPTAKCLTCSEATLTRLLLGSTLASDEMLRQTAILIELGFARYSKLTAAERNQLSEKLGTVSGGIVGFGSVTAAVSAMGSVAGLSAAGITSGLAAIGSFVGGGMVAGIVAVGAIPIVVAGMGYGIIRGVKYLITGNQLNATDLDPKWEIIAPSNEAAP